MKPTQFYSSKDGFLGIEKKDAASLKDAKAVIIPFGIEASVSYGGGTSKGPEAIIEASHQVELFDEDLWCEPHRKIGVATMKPFPIRKKIKDALDQLEDVTSQVVNAGKFPLILGGEHSLSPGAIRPFVEKYKEISLLHFDAHADLRDGYAGEYFSHASALRRCLDYPNVNLVSCGIRNISQSEIPFLEKNKHRINIFWGKDRESWNVNKIISCLKNNPVYITFDVDGFDASLMPATGTPEPGGIFWNDAMKIIKAACKKHKIIGADIVELAPVDKLHYCDFLVAKLAYKILAYSFIKQ